MRKIKVGGATAAVALVVLFLMAPLKPKPAPEKGAATTEVIDLRPYATTTKAVSTETQPTLVRESEQPLEVEVPSAKKGRVTTATILSEVPEHTLNAAEAYIQEYGSVDEREIGGCTFTILRNGEVVIHQYPETLELQDIEEICAPYFPGYTFSNQTTFVVATPE